MYLDFSALLFCFTLGTGAVWGMDRLLWQKQRLRELKAASKNDNAAIKDKEPLIIEYCRSFFPVLLIVFLLRSFLVEPFRIPSGSMKPTLLVGDFILVNKFAYGFRLPIFHHKITKGHTPQRGDVMVFRYPVDPSENFIKRVIALPGDKVKYQGKSLYINGELITKELKGTEHIYDDFGQRTTVNHWLENLGDVQHDIYERDVRGREVIGITIPEGHYFMMGDNRDNSDDSRAWGYVSDEMLVGKAFGIWMSWDSNNFRVRLDRIGDKII